MASFSVSLSQFEHRLAVFLAPFVAAGGYAVEQGIRNGGLTVADEKGIALAFVTGIVIYVLNVLRSVAAPTPAASATLVTSATKVVAAAATDAKEVVAVAAADAKDAIAAAAATKDA